MRSPPHAVSPPDPAPLTPGAFTECVAVNLVARNFSPAHHFMWALFAFPQGAENHSTPRLWREFSAMVTRDLTLTSALKRLRFSLRDPLPDTAPWTPRLERPAARPRDKVNAAALNFVLRNAPTSAIPDRAILLDNVTRLRRWRDKVRRQCDAFSRLRYFRRSERGALAAAGMAQQGPALWRRSVTRERHSRRAALRFG